MQATARHVVIALSDTRKARGKSMVAVRVNCITILYPFVESIFADGSIADS